MKAVDNISLFTPDIEGMINFKTSLGYKKRTYEGYLYDFSRFCSKNYPAQEYLTKELVLAWCVRRSSESQSGFRRRIIPIREFGKYLNTMGIESYVLPSDFTRGGTPFIPYLFSDSELSAILQNQTS